MAPVTRNRLLISPRIMMLALLTALLLCSQEVASFQHSFATTTPKQGFARSIASNTRQASSLNGLEVAASAFDDFFRTQPFLSAFLACSVKASAADFLAQTSSNEVVEEEQGNDKAETKTSPQQLQFWNADTRTTPSAGEAVVLVEDRTFDNVNMYRNLAFLLYGGLYQGMFLQFLYSVVYPCLFGDSEHRVILSVCTDIFCFGPFVTLPIAYILRAIIDDSTTFEDSTSIPESVQQGIAKYKNHVATQGLLYTYWSIWGPAQSLNFGLVPEHYRVFFVAFISFFWVYLLSGISSQQEKPTATQAT